MIKIVKAKYLKDHSIRLYFSDGSMADYDFSYLLDKKTVLTDALKDIDFFKEFFLELGAIGWKNGLEFSPESLYRKAKESGKLQSAEEAA
ncbi:DUF2442 domain-containing protein [Nitratifractor sp.]